MPDPNENERKSSEKRPQQGGSLVWYIVAAAVVLLLVVSLFGGGADPELSMSDLIRLVKVSNSNDPSAVGYIDVRVGSGSSQKTFRYSDLSKVLIDDYDVKGTVTRREVLGMATPVPAEQSADPPPEAEEVPQAEQADAEQQEADAASVDASPVESAIEAMEFRLGKAEANVKFKTNRLPNETALEKALSENGFEDWGFVKPNLWLTYLPSLLLLSLFVVLMIVLMRRMSGAGSPMAFGRSRGKLYAQEDLGVSFSEVAGIDEAVEELREVVEFLRTPEKYQILGGRIPKGVLLVGPPGTGKTLLAKAIAGEAGVPFFSLSGSDFVEMFVGVGAARVRDMFQQAESRAPCIIFIDELDALGKTRGNSIVGGHDEREQTLNALLVEMDGFDSNSGVIVMAASNRPETLDPALLRPGRFDRHVLVDRPDVAGREDILKVHLKNVKVDDSVDVKAIAAITSGFVGADLANLVNEAALLAARNGKSRVTMAEFNEGVERLAAGLEKKKRIMDQDEKQRVAYHEAGHALVACSLPNTDPVHKVSIIPRGLAALGYTMQRPEQDRYLMTQRELESRIQVLLAGTLTEELVFDDISTGAQNDLERSTEIARSMVMEFGMSRLGRINYRESNRSPFLATSGETGQVHSFSEQTAREIDEEVKRIIDESMEKVRGILSHRRAALEAISVKLMEQEVIDATELQQLMDENSSTPMIVPGTNNESKRSSAEAKRTSGKPDSGDSKSSERAGG